MDDVRGPAYKVRWILFLDWKVPKKFPRVVYKIQKFNLPTEFIIKFYNRYYIENLIVGGAFILYLIILNMYALKFN